MASEKKIFEYFFQKFSLSVAMATQPINMVVRGLLQKHLSKTFVKISVVTQKPEDHWSCIAHLSAEDMLKSVVIEEKNV